MKAKAISVIALVCTFVLGAWAQEPVNPQFKYIERSWNGTTVVEEEKTITNYEILSGTADPDAWARLGDEDDKDHYYVVVGGTNVTYKTLNVYGKAHLILCDGATLTCWGGILVEKGHHNAQLFIYGQSGDTGQLIVTNCYDEVAGIGSSEAQLCGEINIHGGNLNITAGYRGAGIGGGSMADGGMLRIYGGKVTAQGGKRGAGIGGGATADGGDMYLYGGEVTATGGTGGAGVGGGGQYNHMFTPGNGGVCGRVYAYGGTLTAHGGYGGAGIGTGEDAQDNVQYKGELFVYEGATVTATGGKEGAGIGGGNSTSGIKTYIYGGTVSAKGGSESAGIGSGEHEFAKIPSKGGETHISGGVVRAVGTGYGAGIGGGAGGYGANVSITGGTVTVIAGGKCKCLNADGGSAIGYGNKISYYKKENEKYAGTLEIGSNMMVTAGNAKDDIDGVFTSDQRVYACRWRDYVKLEPCPHTVQNGEAAAEAITYSIVDESYHDRYCRYCQTVSREGHATMGDCPCGMEGYSFTTYVPVANPEIEGYGYQQKQTYKVKADNEFYLPECDVVPTGYKFLGWEMNPNTAETGYDNWAAVKGGDIGGDNKLSAGTSVKALLGMTPATFYARYLYDFNEEWQWSEDNTSCTLKISGDALGYSEYFNYTQSDMVKEYLTDCVVYSISHTYTLRGYDYVFSTKKSVPYVLTLQDNASNSAAIDQYDEKTATVCLTGRTLYTDGGWNTLCLPFSVDEADFDDWLSMGRGKEVKTLASSSFENGVLTLNFDDADRIVAGKPYLIRWEFNADDKTYYSQFDEMYDTDANIIYYEFEPAVIDNTLRPTETTYVDFVGFFSPVGLTANDKSVLYLGADNTLYYPNAAMTIGACRAYFQLNGITAGDLAPEVRAFVLNFGDEESTGILSTMDYTNDMNDNAWFDLCGRRLNGKPTQSGVYVNGGRKIVIK